MYDFYMRVTTRDSIAQWQNACLHIQRLIVLAPVRQHLCPFQDNLIKLVPILAKSPLVVYGETREWICAENGAVDEMTSDRPTLIHRYKVLGQLLEGSGWVEALHQADIATLGVAESFLTASHITRTRHAHHVTACVLYAMLNEAFAKGQTDNPGLNPINFTD